MNVPDWLLGRWRGSKPGVVDGHLLKSVISIHRDLALDWKSLDVSILFSFALEVDDVVVLRVMYDKWLERLIDFDKIPEKFVGYAQDDPEHYKNHLVTLMERGRPFRSIWIVSVFKDMLISSWDMWLLVPAKDLKWCWDHGLTWCRTASIRALECRQYHLIKDDQFKESQEDFWMNRFIRAVKDQNPFQSSWIFQKCIKNDINKQYFYSSACVSSPSTQEFETLPLPSTTMEASLTQNFVTLRHLRNQPSMHTSPSTFATNTMQY